MIVSAFDAGLNLSNPAISSTTTKDEEFKKADNITKQYSALKQVQT